jgi:uncharacterized membrane protein
MDKQERPPIPAKKSTYSPSWYNKFAAWIDRLPGPSWVAYLGMVLLIAGVGILIPVIENPSKPVFFPPLAILVYFQIAFVLSLLDYLDKRAERALKTLHSTLKEDEEQYPDLKTRLTKLPARQVTIVTLIILFLFTILGLWGYSSPMPDSSLIPSYIWVWLFSQSVHSVYTFLTGVFMWVINGIFIIHTIHQLRIIDDVYTHYAEVNLFKQNELYAFSNVSAGTAIGLVLSGPVWMILAPSVITTIINLTFAILGIIIFVVPIMGVHKQLKNQKDAHLKNGSQKAEAMIQELYARIDKQDLTDIENYERALSSLEKAENKIKSISTWPWETGTIRQFIGALFLPVSIWMIQFYLNQLLTN